MIEGDFAFEVGDERFTLGPGDSLFAPRMVPHGWAHVGDDPGTLLLAVQPAGSLEAFFREGCEMTQPTHAGGSGPDVRRPRDEGRRSTSGRRLSIQRGFTAPAPLFTRVRGKVQRGERPLRALFSRPYSEAENAVFVVFRPCIRPSSWTADQPTTTFSTGWQA